MKPLHQNGSNNDLYCRLLLATYRLSTRVASARSNPTPPREQARCKIQDILELRGGWKREKIKEISWALVTNHFLVPGLKDILESRVSIRRSFQKIKTFFLVHKIGSRMVEESHLNRRESSLSFSPNEILLFSSVACSCSFSQNISQKSGTEGEGRCKLESLLLIVSGRHCLLWGVLQVVLGSSGLLYNTSHDVVQV